MTEPHSPDMTGKVALVTGASRGIGAATVRHLASLGARVVLCARSGDAIEALAGEVGGLAIPTDMADSDAVASAVARTVEAHGRLDLLVNNAGLIEPIARIEDSDPAAWGQVVDVNLKGVYHGIRHALPVMVAQGGGTIVNISSGAAHNALEGWSHYCATKAGVLRLTEAVHKENAAQGLRSIGLSPGTVATEMQREIKASGLNPVSRIEWERHISPDWVARAIAFLSTPAADPFLGRDFTLKTDEERALIGMPAA